MDKWMLKAWEWLWPEMRKILSALLLVAIVSFAVFLLVHYSGVTRASVAFLLPVVIAAIRWGPVAAMAATIIGVAPMVFLLYDPIYDLKVSDPQQVLDLGLYVFVAVVVSRLAAPVERGARAGRGQRSPAGGGRFGFARIADPTRLDPGVGDRARFGGAGRK
ncbi:MAG: DUF4118 domain-containing protein [Pseudorhodoplanes sp.]|nr:DUF4118 domain-containing protein [Pseudorhodoplanes sp.]